MKSLPQPRPYQAEIIEAARSKGNVMVILPTGTGKTLVAFYLLKDVKRGLMLAPTKPLVEQHYRNFTAVFGEEDAALITGETQAKQRAKLYEKRWLFATPQTVANDIKNRLFDHTQLELVVFDECHKAVGDYAYVRIAKALPSKTKILGLTASPGSKRERIVEVVSNLRINHIEIRTEEELKGYLAEKSFSKVYVSLPPEMLEIRAKLKSLYLKYKKRLNDVGIAVPIKKGELMALGSRIMAMQSDVKFTLIKFYVAILHIQHMLELLETQGLSAFLKYASNLAAENKPTTKPLLSEEEFIDAVSLASKAKEKGMEHPKVDKLLELLDVFKDKQIIIFVQYTDNIKRLLEILKAKHYKAEGFMGKRQGFNKKKQKALMDRFRNQDFNILVSSSIGEEGIDIPSVDAVIFYEPIPSEIRSIQRKGRTGRVRAGEVIILITRGTRDEAYFHASSKGEYRMKKVIESIKKELSSKPTTHTASKDELKVMPDNAEPSKEKPSLPSLDESKADTKGVKQKTIDEWL